MSEEDFVLYRDKKDNNKIKSLGYTINTVLPYLNIPVMKGGGKIPGRTKNNNLTIPVGLALLNDAIIKREKQTNIYNSYIPQEEGVGMLPENYINIFLNQMIQILIVVKQEKIAEEGDVGQEKIKKIKFYYDKLD